MDEAEFMGISIDTFGITQQTFSLDDKLINLMKESQTHNQTQQAKPLTQFQERISIHDENPLHLACYNGNFSLLQAMFGEFKPDITMIDAVNKKGNGPLI